MDAANSKKGGSNEARPTERRRNPRFSFIAEAQLLEPKWKTAIAARTSDLSLGGCYVDTINPFPPSTLVNLRLRKWDRTFEAQAMVIYATPGMGMGMQFLAVPQEQREVLEAWIRELGIQQLGESGKDATPKSEPGEDQKDREKMEMKILRIAAILLLFLFGRVAAYAQSGGTVPQQWTIVTTSESAPNAVPITTTPTGAPDPCTTGQNDNPNDSNASCYNPLVITTDWQLSTNFEWNQAIATVDLANAFTNSNCSASGGTQAMTVTGLDLFGYLYTATITVTLLDSNGGIDTIVFTGQPSSNGTQFTGTFTSTGACMKGDSGNFTAVLFSPINGTYQGSFETNGSFSTSGSGTVSMTFATDSNFNLTGTVTAAKGSGLCFSNLTIASALANTYAPSFATGDMLQAIASDNSGNVVLFTASGTDGNGLAEGTDQNGNQKLYLTYQGLAGACSGISGVDVPFSKVAVPKAPRHRPLPFRPRRRA
ncbi:MAG TPA: PilZ domain-containing protein [Candidatus Sulfotelmatobacter sp.]|nr:PilZ domain-containing protein [Candidatus Sulfotelmatobacter sp.]